MIFWMSMRTIMTNVLAEVKHHRVYFLNYSSDMEKLETFAQRLKWAREQKQLSQDELGKLVGVSQSAIGNFESGSRKTSRNLLGLAQALDVAPLWLESGRGDVRPTAPSRRAPMSLIDAAKVKIDTAEELQLLQVYRLADERERRAIDALVSEIRDRIDSRMTQGDQQRS